MAKTGLLPAPTPIALVLCDNVYEASNGKQALVGLFTHITANSFPAVHPRLCAFVSITSVRPNTQCELDIVHAETDELVISMSGPAPAEAGPTTVWDAIFELPPLTFNQPGKYYVRFLGNGQVLMQRSFEVVDIRQVNEEEKGDADENR